MSSLVRLPAIQALSPRVLSVLGLNPGKMTLQGTNTYIIGTGSTRLLIDTGGGGKPEYIQNLKKALTDNDVKVISDILFSHYHHDHIGGLTDVLHLLSMFPDQKNPPRLWKRNDCQPFHVVSSITESKAEPVGRPDVATLIEKTEMDKNQGDIQNNQVNNNDSNNTVKGDAPPGSSLAAWNYSLAPVGALCQTGQRLVGKIKKADSPTPAVDPSHPSSSQSNDTSQSSSYTLHHIEDGQVFKVEGANLTASYSPGHTGDHVTFHLVEDNVLFSGMLYLSIMALLYVAIHYYYTFVCVYINTPPYPSASYTHREIVLVIIRFFSFLADIYLFPSLFT